jgi:O-antigen/teichoic acid export membrane protein
MPRETLSTSEYHGLAKNSLWVMVSNLSMAFILALTVFASRLLGDVVFGQYVFLLAIATLLAELSVLGTVEYVSILTARQSDRTGELVANTLGLRLVFGVVYVLLCQVVVWFCMPEALFVSLLIVLDWLARTVIHLFRGILRARDVFPRDAKIATVERLSVLVCATVGLLIGRSLAAFALGVLLGRTVGVMACLRAYQWLGEHIRVSFCYAEWCVILRGGFPIGIRGMLKGVSFRIDVVMLGLLRTSAEVGWYGAAYKFLEASFFFQEAIGESFQPAISRAFGQNNLARLRDLFGRGYKLLFIIGGLAGAAGFVYADQLVALVFGSTYTHAAEALRILVWAMLMVFGSMTSLMLLDAVESGSKTVLPFALAVVVNVALNACLIPFFGFLGAAWSTLLTESFLTVMLLSLAYRAGYTFPVRWLYGPLVACGAFTMVARLLFPTSMLPGIMLGSGAFIAVIVALRVFDDTDYAYGRMLLLRIAGSGVRSSVWEKSPLRKKTYGA